MSNAGVDLVDAPQVKPGAADNKILLALDRFGVTYKPPAIVTLISGDVDYIQKLFDMKNRHGYTVSL